jgi:hypothetical protein
LIRFYFIYGIDDLLFGRENKKEDQLRIYLRSKSTITRRNNFQNIITSRTSRHDEHALAAVGPKLLGIGLAFHDQEQHVYYPKEGSERLQLPS